MFALPVSLTLRVSLLQAVDWLPTLVAVAGPISDAAESKWPQKPLDGFNLWDALNTNTSSDRTSVYYGLTDEYNGLYGEPPRCC